MKATMSRATSVTVMAASRRCNDCRGTGGVYVNEDLQLEFEVCLKCNGYGWIHGGDDEA